jgi:putative phosphoesterase
VVKFGILADTHITLDTDPKIIKALLSELNTAFQDVEEIIHAGDVCEEYFLMELDQIAPTKCVEGHIDNIKNLERFIKFTAGSYKIGIIHEPPDNMEDFFKKNDLHILIHGHSHMPIIQGTKYNTLILNPGSPTDPKPPPKKPFFQDPVARPTVITLEIDEETDIISTYTINLKYK